MSKDSERYFRNISFDPIETKLFWFTQPLSKEFLRAKAYLCLYESNRRNRLISFQSKMKSVDFELDRISSIHRIYEAGEQSTVEFEYNAVKYGFSYHASSEKALLELLKVKGEGKPMVRKKQEITSKPQPPPVTVETQPTKSPGKALTFIERMHQASKGKSSARVQLPVKQEEIVKAEAAIQIQESPVSTKLVVSTKLSSKLTSKRSFVVSQVARSPTKLVSRSVRNEPNGLEQNQRSHLCVIGSTNILLQFTGGLAKMYGITTNSIRLVHALKFHSHQIIKATYLSNTTQVLLLMKSEPHCLVRFDFEESRTTKLDIRDRFGVDEPIIDFILPRQLYQEQILILTERSSYLLTLPDREKRCGASETISHVTHKNRFKKVHHHSLSGYLAVAEDGEYCLFKSLTATVPFFKHQLPPMASSISYSSNYILYSLGLKLEMVILNKKNSGYLNTALMELQQADIERLGLGQQHFNCVIFSSNRTYILAAVRHILVLWRLYDVVEDQLTYETAVYDQIIDSMTSFTNKDGEFVWLSLANGHRLELLLA